MNIKIRMIPLLPLIHITALNLFFRAEYLKYFSLNHFGSFLSVFGLSATILKISNPEHRGVHSYSRHHE